MIDHAHLVARLRAAFVTASNDDMSKPGTPERERHVARLAAMDDAADALSAPAVTEEMVERGALAALAEGAKWHIVQMSDGGRIYWAALPVDRDTGTAPQRFDTASDAWNFVRKQMARAILTAALGEPAAGPETDPGHDPAAGLPQPDTAGGAESLVCAACGGLLREDCGQAANARFSGKPSPCVPMQSFNEAAIRAEATAKERERLIECVKALPTTSMCPFDSGRANDLEPEDPCPLCGELGTLDSEPKCDGGFRQRVIAAIRGGSHD